MSIINKYNHPRQTLLFVVYVIAQILSKKRIVAFSDLLLETKKKVDGAEFLFVQALDVLFIKDKIKYYPKNDTIEYVEYENK